MTQWYENPLRVFDLALEDPYGQWLDRWTAQDLVNVARQVHANVVNMMIVNEWGQAYFRASRVPQHPQLNGSDRLAEVIEAASEHDLKVLGMWGPTANPILYERHPDWAIRSRDGEISGWGYMHLDPCVHVCRNSPYGEIVLETLEELFDRYALDGVAFDYCAAGGCYCHYCLEKYSKQRNMALGAATDWTEQQDRQFADWAMEDAEGFLSRTVQIAHSHGAIIVGGYKPCDVLFAEPHTGGMISLEDKGFLIRQTEARARVENKPQVICTPYSHLYYVGLAKPPQHMRQEFREIVMSNASPWLVIWDWEWIRDKRGLSGIGKVFEEVRDHEVYLKNARSLKHAALLVSERAARLLGEKAYGSVDPAKGWYDALIRAHIPVDVILDEELTTERLSEYRALILADARFLDDDQVQAVKGFVSQGGGLVASHKTSLYDDEGCFRRGFALKEVFGCEFQAVMDAPWTYIGFSESHPVNDGFEPDLLLMHGLMKSVEARLEPDQSKAGLKGVTGDASHQLKVAPVNAGRAIATIFDSAKPLGSYFLKDLSPAIPGKDTGYPAVVVNSYGKGKVVYFPGQVDRLFYRIGHPDYERLLLNSLYFVAGRPTVIVEAPTTVEATFFQQAEPGRLIIHLLNHTYGQLFPAPTTSHYGSFSRDVFRPVGDMVPVGDIQVSLQPSDNAKVERILSLSTLEDVPYRSDEQGIHFRLGRLDEYEALVVEYAK